MMWASIIERPDAWQARRAAIAVPIATVKKFIDDDAAGLGVQVAYWGFFSVFSLLLAFVSILGFAFHNDPFFQKQVLDSTLRLMPVIGPQISGHIGSLTGNTLALVVGLAAAVWTGLGVTLAIGNVLDHLWAVPQADRHGFVKSRMRGLLVLASLGTITVAATATVGLATAGAITPAIPKALGITAAFGIDLAVFLASFRLLTAASVTIRRVLPGAVLAAASSADRGVYAGGGVAVEKDGATAVQLHNGCPHPYRVMTSAQPTACLVSWDRRASHLNSAVARPQALAGGLWLEFERAQRRT